MRAAYGAKMAMSDLATQKGDCHVTVTFLSGQVRLTEKPLRHRAALMAYSVMQVCFYLKNVFSASLAHPLAGFI